MLLHSSPPPIFDALHSGLRSPDDSVYERDKNNTKNYKNSSSRRLTKQESHV
ncbi:hypothetical protein Sarmat_00187 [Rickettsiales endosymbiont of Paramecium tredecaurelia]|nr:hypothetical protein [Candidatus Sarmatiella mevalonica]